MTSCTPTVLCPETDDCVPLRVYVLDDRTIDYGVKTFVVLASSEEDAYQLAEIAPEERSHYHIDVVELTRQLVECIWYVE